VNEAMFTGFTMETLLYGVNSVVYPVSLVILLWRRRARSRHQSKRMIIATSLLYFMASMHFWFQFGSKYQALFYDIDVHVESPFNRAADVVASLTDFVGQLVLMHRLWVIWGRKRYMVILPLIVAVVSLLCLNASFYIWAHAQAVTDFPSEDSIPVGTVGFTLSGMLSLAMTSLIVSRIWWISSGVKKTLNGANVIPKENSSSVRIAIEVSIESGLVVAMLQVVLVTFYAIGHPALVLVWSMAAQIYAMAPTLIILRVGLTAPPGDSSAHTTAVSTIRFTSDTDESEGEPPTTAITFRTYHSFESDLEPGSAAKDKESEH